MGHRLRSSMTIRSFSPVTARNDPATMPQEAQMKEEQTPSTTIVRASLYAAMLSRKMVRGYLDSTACMTKNQCGTRSKAFARSRRTQI